MWRGFVVSVFLLLFAVGASGAAVPCVDCVEVKTRAPHNPLVKVWYRVPKGYDPAGRKVYRVLVLFGGRNCDGKPEVSGKLGWTEWADLNGIFLVAPTLKDDNYWEPKAWSGRALLDALSAIGLRYRIAQTGLLYYGYSAGSQASNLFPEWRPDLCRAYVSHACGYFHRPTARMKSVAGLVTCGDADPARYVISRTFVAEYRKLGITVVWKSFPNHPHDVPPDSVCLAKEFLLYYHWSHLEDLGEEPVRADNSSFVGDDADGVYYAAGGAEAGDIPEDDRVPLASETMAAAWGRPGRRRVQNCQEAILVTNHVDGIEVVTFVPARVRADSRILLLFGGRGWPGARSIRELGFREWADEHNWCVISPSFVNGDYWEPGSGSAEVVRKAVLSVRRKYGLRALPVFAFGYSAGGQLTALLQEHDPSLFAAWGVYGCGVYPESTTAKLPGLVICGQEDIGRFRISRDFVCRYRESGGLLLWKPIHSGHELSPCVAELVKLYFGAIEEGRPCQVWGEDDVRAVRPVDTIDPEYRNPLFTSRLADLWRSDI